MNEKQIIGACIIAGTLILTFIIGSSIVGGVGGTTMMVFSGIMMFSCLIMIGVFFLMDGDL